MDNRISILIEKHLNGDLTADEQQVLENWLVQKPSHQELFMQLTTSKGLQDEMKGFAHMPYSEKEAWKRHVKRYPLPVAGSKVVRMFLGGWRKYAAILVFAVGIVAFYYYFMPADNVNQPSQPVATKLDLKPGSAGAILTLSDGKKVPLDSIDQTILQGSITLKARSGQLVYSNSPNAPSNVVMWNTLTTGRGQIYPLVLSDGSKIWLNAATSIKYPVQFTGNERHVEINGEAFFEVKADKERPFYVTLTGTNGSEGPVKIRVTGTVFNVYNYYDEPQKVTTLLEGKIQMLTSASHNPSTTLSLKPGQQAVYSGSTVLTGHIIATADTEAAVAWKNGSFQFEQTDLPAVMRQLARWYNVDMVCQGAVAKRVFSGEIDRSLNAAEVLKVLEDVNVHFKVEDNGRRIVAYE